MISVILTGLIIEMAWVKTQKSVLNQIIKKYGFEKTKQSIKFKITRLLLIASVVIPFWGLLLIILTTIGIDEIIKLKTKEELEEKLRNMELIK